MPEFLYRYQRCLLIAAEGWKFCGNGYGDFCYFMKGDEMLQWQSLETHRFAASFLNCSTSTAREFWREVNALRNNPQIEYYI